MIQTAAVTGYEYPVRPKPRNFVVGVIDEKSQLELALQDLEFQGFSRDSLIVFHGKAGADFIRSTGGLSGPEAWARRIAEFLNSEAGFKEKHAQEAERGRYVIGIALPGPQTESRNRACSILKSHSGHFITSGIESTYTLLDY